MDSQKLQDALAKLAPSLDADGFDLRLGDIAGDGTVQVLLEAKPNACLDCLVPQEMLLATIEKAISQEGESAKVVLVRIGFPD